MDCSGKPPLLEAAIEQSDYAVVITTAELDPPGPAIVHVNAAFTRLTGYTREELLGATPRILQGPDTDRAVLDRLVSNLRAGDSFEGSTWNYKKDGTPYQVEWTITRMTLKEGGIDYFLSVQHNVTERHPTQEKLSRHTRRLNAILNTAGSNHDPITGALNHRGMLLRLQRLIDEAKATQSVTGFVALQFRRLNRVDQAFGFEAINQLMSDIGEHLESRLEAGESLARTHEHTLAVLIPVDADAAGDPDLHLMARAGEFVAAVHEGDFEIEGNALRVDVSAGISRAPTNSNDAHELAVLSDEAAQRAPISDAVPIRWANHTIKEAKRREITFEGDLQHAVTEREMVLFYQPILDLTCNEVVGAEALLRWPQPEGQPPIGPDQFIPLAEELGLMGRLGTQVFEDACHQLARWQELPGSAAFWVSVNVAPVQLRDPDLTDRFIAITQATGVSPSCVHLEITESALEQDLDEISPVLNKLAAAGFPLALDDFGTGYSSLGRMLDMPFNIIKVDKSFVRQTPDGRGAGVVASLSHLSSYLDIHALGEGVETAAHEAFLRECNYRYAQGFRYAKPMAAAEFAIWTGWPT
ncbi:MAG: EAL domain-containing protein [Gammaproteobacteria bacterium]|nr:EAL domain-containing protein [Gammaproteobacteria bacterium]